MIIFVSLPTIPLCRVLLYQEPKRIWAQLAGPLRHCENGCRPFDTVRSTLPSSMWPHRDRAMLPIQTAVAQLEDQHS